MKNIERLISQNKSWAQAQIDRDPAFFERLEAAQKPKFLWIGCSDSRVPATEITGALPGEIFVHRNIANLVVHTDLNLVSVLEYAVHHLKVKHVIVCGHYGCGGVEAAVSKKSFGILNKWLRNIKDVYRAHGEELSSMADPRMRLRRLVEVNVEEQVLNLAKMESIQKAWKRRNAPLLHGWVYDLHDGIIHRLIQLGPDSNIDPLYLYDEL